MSEDPDLPVIYLVDSSIDITGAFICARNEAEQLKGIARVHLVLPRESRISTDQLKPFEKVIRLPLFNLSRSPSSFIFYLPLLFQSSWQLWRKMRANRAVRLQLNDFYLMHGVICRLLGYRGIIITWIRFDPRRFVWPLSKLWLILASWGSDHLVSVSRFIQGAMPGFETVLLYDYAYHGKRCKEIVQLAPPQGVARLVYVGNYIPGKGQADAITAFAYVVDKYPNLVLEFYGSDMGLDRNRKYRTKLENTVERLGLGQSVQFGGFVENTGKVLRNAYAAINFSYSESFSMTVLEASEAGLPVIASRSGGPQEIIEDGVTGLLVPVGNIQAMSAAIIELVSDPVRARVMGDAGRRLVKRRFSADAFLVRLMEVFDLKQDR